MKKILIGIVVLVIALIVIFREQINDIRLLYNYSAFFEKENIEHNFRTAHELYPSIKIPKTNETFNIPKSLQDSLLSETFKYEGIKYSIKEEIEKRKLTSFLILKDGNLIYEKYFRGNTKDNPVIIFSCTKSIISLLTGIALESGAIKDLNDTVVKYVPELKGTVYENVTIQNLLNMSSGVQWIEDYDALDSEIVQSLLAALKGSVNDYAKEMSRVRKQGVFNQYTSMDTQILSMLIAGATNTKIEDYFYDKLWEKLGAENDAYFITDKTGYPLTYGGLIITPRDLSKIGLLMLNEGKNYKGEQLFSSNWIEESINTSALHLIQGKSNPNSDANEGYKNQWWVPLERDGTDFSAIGIYGQSLYINPERNIIITSTSAYPDYTEDYEHADSRRLKMFQTIAKSIDTK